MNRLAVEDPQLSRLTHAIAERIGAQRFAVWFSNSAKFDLRNDSLEINVPNDFISEWIGTHYARSIQEATHEVFGSALPVRFNIVPQLFEAGADQANGATATAVATAPAKVAGKMNGHSTAHANGHTLGVKMPVDVAPAVRPHTNGHAPNGHTALPASPRVGVAAPIDRAASVAAGAFNSARPVSGPLVRRRPRMCPPAPSTAIRPPHPSPARACVTA
ncbi:MAG: DnaA N-terminal domain-containing protein [Tepidisphaeraceae bacterium]